MQGNYALSFYMAQNVLCWSKKLIRFSASSKTFVPAQKRNLLNGYFLLLWHKMFATCTKYITIFGQTQNILKPVEGQGINLIEFFHKIQLDLSSNVQCQMSKLPSIFIGGFLISNFSLI